MSFSDFGGCCALSALEVLLEAEKEVATTEAEAASEEAEAEEVADAQEVIAVG